MGGGKKRLSDSTFASKRKKSRPNSKASIVSTLKGQNFSDSDIEKAEFLDSQTIREGMVLLGCVIEIRRNCLVMSLPGCLSGTVSLNNISNPFSKSLRDCIENSELIEPSLNSFIKVGMVFPCKVINKFQDESKRKIAIILSINPQDINTDLKPPSLYSKMVLFVSVCSIEDHGYIVDVGAKSIQGFMPKPVAEGMKKELMVGEVVPSFIKHINFSEQETSAQVQLSILDFNQDFPETLVDDIKLHSILPGAKIRADVIEVKHPFVYMKYMCFDACASVLSLGSTYKAITVGSTIVGTVLYVHPISHMIYLMLNLKPSPDLFPKYFGLKKYAIVESLKFQYRCRSKDFFKINKGTYGFINNKPQKLIESTSESTGICNVSKACIIFFHYMDNLVHMSTKPCILEKTNILPEEVQVGDIYDAVVKDHVQNGMFLEICRGVSGFVQRVHMSDVFVTKPEILYPIGSKTRCRVLSTGDQSQTILTCKESMLKLTDQYILSSYDNIEPGQFYKGVIVKKTDEYILVLFFSDIKGIVSSSDIPEGSIFFEGQTVLCKIVTFNVFKKKLTLSLKTEGLCSVQDARNSSKKSFESHPKLKLKKKNKLASILSSGESYNSNWIREYKSGTPLEATIFKVKGDQLHIVINNIKGRVHITELGCINENVFPLRKFSALQKIPIYITGEYTKKRRNYLKISHRNFKLFVECSMKFPSISASQDLKPGSSLIGYIKEVHDTFAILWLTPTETGILDYLHFSENPKIARKLRRSLKLGLSVKVSVLCNESHSEKYNASTSSSITLTKIDESTPQTGKNILGLVLITCLERGVILKLPFGYNGGVAITDLADVYGPAQMLLDNCRKAKYLLCHVLEVNHSTRYCQLSLRKSRVCGNKTTPSPSFCPEITEDSIEEGAIVKGFIKSTTNSIISVVIGRNLQGKIQIHKSVSADLGLCTTGENQTVKSPIGRVVEVVIKEKSEGGRPLLLAFTNCTSTEDTKCNILDRLDVAEDISWDEVE